MSDHDKLSTAPAQAALQKLRALTETASKFATKARALNTRIAYEKQCRAFDTWCAQHGLSSMPATPQTLALYLAYRATEPSERTGKPWKLSTLEQALSAISQAHIVAGHLSPRDDRIVTEVWKGIRREDQREARQKAPLRTDHLQKIVSTLPETFAGLRDRALLLCGFASACRSAEIVAWNTDDLSSETVDGIKMLRVTIRRSKTDQEGKGSFKWIEYGKDEATCPARNLQRWLDESEIDEGAIFRRIRKGGHITEDRLQSTAVALILRRAIDKAELDLDTEDFASHSLRAGFVTEATARGVGFPAIMEQTQHKSLETLRLYIRKIKPGEDPASGKLGL